MATLWKRTGEAKRPAALFMKASEAIQRKGISKTAVAAAQLYRDHGIEGDAHAGPGHR